MLTQTKRRQFLEEGVVMKKIFLGCFFLLFGSLFASTERESDFKRYPDSLQETLKFYVADGDWDNVGLWLRTTNKRDQQRNEEVIEALLTYIKDVSIEKKKDRKNGLFLLLCTGIKDLRREIVILYGEAVKAERDNLAEILLRFT